eukprot:SAG11_NODE_9878_length_873_cov_0.916021_1_plen_76_part_10
MLVCTLCFSWCSLLGQTAPFLKQKNSIGDARDALDRVHVPRATSRNSTVHAANAQVLTNGRQSVYTRCLLLLLRTS